MFYLYEVDVSSIGINPDAQYFIYVLYLELQFSSSDSDFKQLSMLILIPALSGCVNVFLSQLLPMCMQLGLPANLRG